MQKLSLLFFSIWLALTSAGFAGEEIFRMGMVFDPENGVWLKDQVFVVRDGKIISSNPKVLPPEAPIHDFKNHFVIPGLVDAHTHLFLDDPSMGKDFAKGLHQFVTGVKGNSREELGKIRMKSLIKSGFTTVRDLGNSGDIDIRSLENDKSPRLFTSGKGLVASHGQFPAGVPEKVLRSEYESIHQNPDDVFKKFNFDLVKLYADEEPNPAITDPEILKKWVTQAHKNNYSVAVHAIFKAAIDNTIVSGADTLEHGYEITTDQLKLMSQKKMIFVPTNANVLLMNLPLKERPEGLPGQLARFCENIKNAKASNVEIAFGSDNYFALEKYGKSFGEGTVDCLLHYKSCGLTPEETLKAATVTAAKTMGKAKVLGNLKEGYFADFIIFKKNPLKNMEELKRPVKVFKNGKEV